MSWCAERGAQVAHANTDVVSDIQVVLDEVLENEPQNVMLKVPDVQPILRILLNFTMYLEV